MSQTSRRPTVLIQVDLDSLWAVKTVYGLSVSQRDFDDDPLYLLGMARFLDLFRKRGVRATFFAIGRDCAAPAKQALLRRAAAEGHEIANHSQNHLVGLGARNPEEIAREIRLAGDAIESATGCRPVGFRAPGYDASPPVLQAVARAGMLYDSSVLPRRAGGLLRAAAAFFGRGKGRDGAAGVSAGHYGSGPVWKAPRAPYIPDLAAPWKAVSFRLQPEGCTTNSDIEAPWKLGTPEKGHAEACTLNNLVELPVGVTPFLRLPVHASVAMAAGWAWTRMALGGLIRSSPSALVYVFHAIDLVGGEDLPGLPGGWLGRRVFRQSLARKAGFVEGVLGLLLARCDSRLSRDFAEEEAAGQSSRPGGAVE